VSLPGQPRFVRLGETNRARIAFTLDGEAIEALEGDSLLVAILTARGKLRRSEFGPEVRSGFCLMAACQDCWVWTADGNRLRACDTPVRTGLSLLTEQPDVSWPTRV
jgi:predicted molibdopterin-dependent oxidoreductase YjgC